MLIRQVRTDRLRSVLFLFILLCLSVSNVHASYELVEIYDGSAEWTSEITHDGESVVKLLVPEAARTGSGAIVRTSLNIPFNEFESFSYDISYYSARPRFLIYLDTTANDEVDTVLLSDYQDFGNGEWTHATGGLRWGWTSVDYPLPSWYGDPWNPLIYWQNMFINAQVLSSGVYLEYWGAHPEGIGESLYVSPFPEVCTNSGIQNTYLSLEPSLLEVPFLDSESAQTFIEVAMKVYDISNMKEFHVDFEYDDNVLEYYSGKIDQTFYLTVRGGTGSEVDKQITDAFSGSITMYRYTFRVIGPGTTTISLENSELLDEGGVSIPFTPLDCTVSVVTLSDYTNGLLEELEITYSSLNVNYSVLQSNYQNLDSIYTTLQSSYEAIQLNYTEFEKAYITLDKQHAILNTLYNGLYSDYDCLNSTYSKLGEAYDELDASLDDIQSKYHELFYNYTKKNEAYFELVRELDDARNLFLLTASFAVLFFVIIVSKYKQIFR